MEIYFVVIRHGSKDNIVFPLLATGKHNAKEIPIELGKEHLEYVKEFKYLGVTFTSNLRWERHLELTKGAILRKLHNAWSIFDNTKGLNLVGGEWIHRAIIIPKATYGAVVWASHNLTQREHNLLGQINRIGLNVRTRVKRSTPTKKLEIIMNTLPMDIQAQGSALKTWCRIKHSITQDWDGITSNPKRHPLAHRTWLESKLTEINLSGQTLEKANQRLHISPVSSTERSSTRGLKKWYTDASWKDGHTGIGIVTTDVEDNIQHSSGLYLGQLCTVVDAESIAIWTATQEAQAHRGPAIIYSDSKWANVTTQNFHCRKEKSHQK